MTERRKTPVVRWVLITTIVAVVGIAAYVAFETRRHFHALPVQGPDRLATLQQLTALELGRDPNAAKSAWRTLKSIAEEHQRIFDETTARIAADATRKRPRLTAFEPNVLRCERSTRPDISNELDVLAALDESNVFDAFHAWATSEAPALEPDPKFGFDTQTLIRDLRGTLAAAMCIASERGDHDRVVMLAETMFAVAHTLLHQPSMLYAIAGEAFQALAMEEVRMHLLDHDVPGETIRRLMDAIDRWPEVASRAILEREAVVARTELDLLFSDRGHVLADAVASFDGRASGSFIDAFRGRFALASHDDCVSLFETRLTEVLAGLDEPELSPDLVYETLAWDSPTDTVELAIDALRAHIPHHVTLQTLRAGTEIMLALEMYFVRHGGWPETLDELAPDIVPAVPLDPMHGMPFIYRVDGETYVLQALGLDGIEGDRSARADLGVLFDRTPGADLRFDIGRRAYEE